MPPKKLKWLKLSLGGLVAFCALVAPFVLVKPRHDPEKSYFLSNIHHSEEGISFSISPVNRNQPSNNQEISCSLPYEGNDPKLRNLSVDERPLLEKISVKGDPLINFLLEPTWINYRFPESDLGSYYEIQGHGASWEASGESYSLNNPQGLEKAFERLEEQEIKTSKNPTLLSK